MNPDAIKELLLYSLAFNYAILIIWFGVFSLAHDWMYSLHSRWFRFSVEVFDALHYSSMAALQDWNHHAEYYASGRTLVGILKRIFSDPI